jgi:hypothetical protein
VKRDIETPFEDDGAGAAAAGDAGLVKFEFILDGLDAAYQEIAEAIIAAVESGATAEEAIANAPGTLEQKSVLADCIRITPVAQA